MQTHTTQNQVNSTTTKETSLTTEVRFNRLESIVEQIGEAVIASTETVERLAQRVDALVVEVQNQGHQVQQQGYQIFALSDALQTLVDSQSESKIQLTQLTESLRLFLNEINPENQNRDS